MIYTLDNGRCVSIPIGEIDTIVKKLKISKDEALELWLADNGYEINEEQAELDEKASKVHINKDAVSENEPKQRKKPEIKVSEEKKELFTVIYSNLDEIFGENVKVLNENKLIEVQINDKIFKIDIVQRRPSKDKA